VVVAAAYWTLRNLPPRIAAELRSRVLFAAHSVEQIFACAAGESLVELLQRIDAHRLDHARRRCDRLWRRLNDYCGLRFGKLGLYLGRSRRLAGLPHRGRWHDFRHQAIGGQAS